MKAAEWIDRLRAVRGWESDYRVAKELGVGRAVVSRYRNHPNSTMDDDVAIRLAAALDQDPEVIILDQITERTKSEPARAVLSALLERLLRKNPLAGSGGAAAPACAERAPVDISPVTPISAPSAKKAGEPETRHRNTHRIAQQLAIWMRAALPAPALRTAV